VVASERGGEGVRGCVAGAVSDLVEGQFAGTEVVAGQGHPPVCQVPHRCLAECAFEVAGEGGTGQPAQVGELGHGPWVARVGVDRVQGRTEPGIGGGLIPAGCGRALLKAGPQGQYQQDIEEAVQDGLLTGARVAQLS
jgi:hypothetical protein